MERLIVKNFGPLKDVDIELNKINLFIMFVVSLFCPKLRIQLWLLSSQRDRNH